MPSSPVQNKISWADAEEEDATAADKPDDSQYRQSERPSVSSGRRCFSCGSPDHIKRDCPDADRRTTSHGWSSSSSSSMRKGCFNCGGAHVRANCPNRACYTCGESGHMSRDCPFRRGDGTYENFGGRRRDDENHDDVGGGGSGGGRGRKLGDCHNCGQPGHWARECPENPPRQNNPVGRQSNPIDHKDDHDADKGRFARPRDEIIRRIPRSSIVTDKPVSTIAAIKPTQTRPITAAASAAAATPEKSQK